MVVEIRNVTGEMTVAMVERHCANIDITNDDDFAAFIHELSDPFLQHKVKVHFVRKASIRGFVWTVDVDQHEQLEVCDQGTTFSIQGGEVTGSTALLVGYQFDFMCTGI